MLRPLLLALSLAFATSGSAAAAQAAVAMTTGALTAEAVLAASARAVPTILEARSQRAAVVAQRLAAEGGFDRTLSQGMRQWVLGDYNGFDADLKLTQPLATLGGDLTQLLLLLPLTTSTTTTTATIATANAATNATSH